MKQYGKKKICRNCKHFLKSSAHFYFDTQTHICNVDMHEVYHSRHHCTIPENFISRIK